MARYNAMDASWEKVEVLGKEGLFTCLRIDRKTIPKGCYMYEVRHSDYDWCEPVEVALGVLVNFYGTLMTFEPLELEPAENLDNAYVDIDPENDWKYLDEIVRFKMEWVLV